MVIPLGKDTCNALVDEHTAAWHISWASVLHNLASESSILVLSWISIKRLAG
jgi:hypothetical protein